MNIYESVVLFRPIHAHAEKSIKKFTKLMQSFSTKKKVKVDSMGIKHLAYKIREEDAGWYTVFTFESNPENIADLERQFRIDDDVLKFMTVKHYDDDFEFQEDCLEDLAPGSPDGNKSEQEQLDAEDVLLGLAHYNNK